MDTFALCVRRTLAGFLLPLGIVSAQAPEPRAETLQDFAQQATIATQGESSYVYFSLPFEVYQGSQSANLADVRVFNARGELVPYALSRSKTQQDIQQSTQTVPWFPLSEKESSKDDAEVSIERRENGQITVVKTRVPIEKHKERAILVDLSQGSGFLTRLRIESDDAEAILHFSVEASDDLRHWRTILSDGVFTHLQHQGQQIIQDDIQFNGTREKYLRIRWANQQKAPQIKRVQASWQESQQTKPPILWSPPLRASVHPKGLFEYRWNAELPVERLDIELSEINTVVQLHAQDILDNAPLVTTKPQKHLRLFPPIVKQERGIQNTPILASAIVYRLHDDRPSAARLAEIKQSELLLDGRVRSGIILRTDAVDEANTRFLTQNPPQIRLGFTPQNLVFLARGPAPFYLAWGKTGARSTALALHTLAPQQGGSETLPGLAATLRAISPPIAPVKSSQNTVNAVQTPAAPAAQNPAQTTPQKPSQQTNESRWLLWVALVVGVLVLAAMVLSLGRDAKKSPKDAANNAPNNAPPT